MPNPGEILGKNYRVVEVHAGGMGEVYICEILNAGETESAKGPDDLPPRLALKTFQRRFFFDNATRHAFVREASTWLRLSGLPNILPVLRVETIEERPFLMMPEVKQGPLGERSIADLLRHGPLEPETVLKFAFQIALGMRSARNRINGLVHGDLKPENILLINGDAYIADFGMAFSPKLGLPEDRLESSWAYKAPELWDKESRISSVKTDVYAFGTLLFECLIGQTPFVEDPSNRNTWAAAHREKDPKPLEGIPPEGLPAALFALALACLEKNPKDRPKDFDAVLNHIFEIGREYDPAQLLMYMLGAQNVDTALTEQKEYLFRERINSLLHMGEAAQALEELEALDESEYDATLWLRRGTALSLLERDKEALPYIERARAIGLPPEDKLHGETEFALSLKRLGRFQEAEVIYKELQLTVSDDDLPAVVINLATVYLEQGQWEKCVRVLEPFVRKQPEWAPAWGNLGLAYTNLGRYEQAERAYGRALVLAPNEGKIRVMLAGLYMDHMGRIEEAWQALDQAFDSGYESRDWLVRMLASSLLLNKRDTLQGLFIGLKNNFEQSLADAMIEESQQMAKELYEKYTESAVEDSKEEQPESVDPVIADTSDDGDLDVTNDHEEDDLEPVRQNFEQTKPGLPFINFRIYEFFDFTIDYYQSPEAPDYLETFFREYRRALRDPLYSDSNMSLRGSPFYFTQCPNCAVHVLTNRDIGKRINCRMCGQSWHTSPLHGTLTDQYLERVSEEIGVQQETGQDIIHALFVQPREGTDEDAISQVCEESGLTRLGKDDMLAIAVLREFAKRDIDMNSPWSIWTVRERESKWIQGMTPQKIAKIVQEIQIISPGVLTMSTTLSLEDAIQIGMGRSVQEVYKKMEEDSRANIREGRAGAEDYRQLAKVLLSTGNLVEAEQKARAAAAVDERSPVSWEILGEVLFKREKYQLAKEAFERALDLNPASVITLLFLSVCCQKLGDETLSREFRIRANSLSGGELPWI